MVSGAKITKDDLRKILKSLDTLIAKDVLVGVPASEAAREDGPINNATIGYISENGSPVNNTPARPWLAPAIRDAQKDIEAKMRLAAQRVLEGDVQGVARILESVGVLAMVAAKKKIRSNIPPELSERTLANRRRRGITRTNTLVDTGEFINSVNYVVRSK